MTRINLAAYVDVSSESRYDNYFPVFSFKNKSRGNISPILTVYLAKV